ncbi:WhiB family transcription factor [Gordonia phage Forza]|uniref:WhiB family transcription factor n=1 Tax=Gordonia phage Forza TaxID=2571247 RepID=A0A650EYE9_9CAUD|nr:WhiB transcriptional factor [Gordonia phage Forza]QEM41587.1 WhiB family transcription factor [Gordonia phage Boopy]QGT55113.1 WhiB family transcription factor [Gordonia phage Forza]UXE04261.1 WhiB family transcription factor [Gordonia phage BlueNGold]WBF03901.1 WhiB family transcription factor [Gordonia phage Mareelih]
MVRSAAMSNFWREVDYFPDFPRALCKGSTKPLWDFQLNDQEKLIARGRRHDKAIRICGKCVHADACFSWGYKNGMHGVWGGQVLTPNGRTYLRCTNCGKAMIKSRFQKPPRGFRNRHSNSVCTRCASLGVKSRIA